MRPARVAEIEAQFSGQGTVHDGQSRGRSPEGLDAVRCSWEIGESSEDLPPPTVNLSILVDPNASAEEFLATRREDSSGQHGAHCLLTAPADPRGPHRRCGRGHADRDVTFSG